jgi:hypothetical protein
MVTEGWRSNLRTSPEGDCGALPLSLMEVTVGLGGGGNLDDKDNRLAVSESWVAEDTALTRRELRRGQSGQSSKSLEVTSFMTVLGMNQEGRGQEQQSLWVHLFRSGSHLAILPNSIAKRVRWKEDQKQQEWDHVP